MGDKQASRDALATARKERWPALRRLLDQEASMRDLYRALNWPLTPEDYRQRLTAQKRRA